VPRPTLKILLLVRLSVAICVISTPSDQITIAS
jgi:hypothetical protein